MDDRSVAFKNALLSLDRLGALKVLQKANLKIGSVECAETIVLPVMEEIGIQWETGNIALSQVYMSGKICEEVVDTILPAKSPQRTRQPKAAIVALHDHHSLGKRIVYSILRSAGFELKDFGAGNSVEQVAGRAVKEGVEVLLVSTLMLNAALMVKELREQLDSRGALIKIIVGGAPFRLDPNLWKEVGADAVAKQASEAVKVLKKVMEEIL